LLHDLNIGEVRFDLRAVLGVEPRQIVAALELLVEVTLRKGRGKLGAEPLLNQERQKRFEANVRALQRA
jgi:hypothetical protein